MKKSLNTFRVYILCILGLIALLYVSRRAGGVSPRGRHVVRTLAVHQSAENAHDSYDSPTLPSTESSMPMPAAAPSSGLEDLSHLQEPQAVADSGSYEDDPGNIPYEEDGSNRFVATTNRLSIAEWHVGGLVGGAVAVDASGRRIATIRSNSDSIDGTAEPGAHGYHVQAGELSGNVDISFENDDPSRPRVKPDDSTDPTLARIVENLLASEQAQGT